MAVSKIVLEDYTVFLVDVSGVLQSNGNYFDAAIRSLEILQEKGAVFLVTNNSYAYPPEISRRVHAKTGILIDPEYIISSGHGLSQDKSMQALLRGKSVYFLGYESSLPYLLDAEIGRQVDAVEDADAVVLASFSERDPQEQIHRLIDGLKKRPDLPVICCNPDRHIVFSDPNDNQEPFTFQRLYPVIGYYAEQIETAIQRPITWYGKPFNNFSQLVKTRVQSLGHQIGPQTLFFDDNLHNTLQMKQHLSLTAAWIHGTGIQQQTPAKTLTQNTPSPDYTLPALSPLHFQ